MAPMSLDDPWRRLLAAARDASAQAHCPYSQFPVGAAVWAAEKSSRDAGSADEFNEANLFIGCNVENVSFGLTSCAERNAICQAIAHGRPHILRVAVYTPTSKPATPCGACRQVIWEFNRQAGVLCACDDARWSAYQISELLPVAFGETSR